MAPKFSWVPGTGIIHDLKGRRSVCLQLHVSPPLRPFLLAYLHSMCEAGLLRWIDDPMLIDSTARSECYLSDWTDGLKAHVQILAPATYIFFASVIPALTFGEQLADETGGQVLRCASALLKRADQSAVFEFS